MRLDRLLAHEMISRKAMETGTFEKEILVDDCPAHSLAQNIDTGLQKLVFKDDRFKDTSTPTSCFISQR